MFRTQVLELDISSRFGFWVNVYVSYILYGAMAFVFWAFFWKVAAFDLGLPFLLSFTVTTVFGVPVACILIRDLSWRRGFIGENGRTLEGQALNEAYRALPKWPELPWRPSSQSVPTA